MAKKKTKDLSNRGLRDQIRNIVAEEMEKLPDTLSQLEPKERVKALAILLQFVDFTDINWGGSWN